MMTAHPPIATSPYPSRTAITGQMVFMPSAGGSIRFAPGIGIGPRTCVHPGGTWTSRPGGMTNLSNGIMALTSTAAYTWSANALTGNPWDGFLKITACPRTYYMILMQIQQMNSPRWHSFPIHLLIPLNRNSFWT